MRDRPEDYDDIVLIFPLGSPAKNGALPIHLKRGVIFHQRLPNLFAFSYIVRQNDGEPLQFVLMSFVLLLYSSGRHYR
jgi:hypothetical protein